MSAGSPEEMSGFLDVKVPAPARRRRGLAPWKAWKKQWITVRSASDSGVQVQLGSTCVRVPSKAILCRSESRSRPFAFGVFACSEPRRATLFLAGSSETETQRWVRHIRHLLRPPNNDGTVAGGFPVSFIDNAHSRLAGLSGAYGNLVVGPHCLTLHDSSSDNPIFSWKWHQMHQFHLAATEIKDDENRICVIHTSSEFCASAGQLHVFCLQAPALLDRLLASGRVQRLLSSPLPSPPPLQRGARRLSRSESDLYCFTGKEKALGSPRQHHNFMRHKAVLERSQSSSRTSATSDDYVQAIGGKVASSLISAGLGLLFSTPACSEADTESLHEYQQVGSLESDEYDDEPGNSPLSTRRESGISIASGIYEEIADGDRLDSTNHYENPATLRCSRAAEDMGGDLPPPLPPRKQKHHLLDSIHKEVAREWCYRMPPTSARNGAATSCSPNFAHCLPPHHSAWESNIPPQPEPDYLPMSPGLARVVAEEQHYTVMASVNTT